MTGYLADAPALARWCTSVLGEVRLGPEEATVFMSAALVLLPREVVSRLGLRDAGAVPEPVRAALRALWLRTGIGPPAPAPMPEHPLAPGLLGVCWRRLRSAFAPDRRHDLR
jgi:hypothetical protein